MWPREGSPSMAAVRRRAGGDVCGVGGPGGSPGAEPPLLPRPFLGLHTACLSANLRPWPSPSLLGLQPPEVMPPATWRSVLGARDPGRHPCTRVPGHIPLC